MIAQSVAAITPILLACASSETTKDYRVDLAYGGTWCDAEKCLDNTDDDWLCWATCAANVLAWTGWGTEAGFEDEDAIVKYLSERWTDSGDGAPSETWRWWFAGKRKYTGGSQVRVPGGGFWKEKGFPDHDWQNRKGTLFRGIGHVEIKRNPLALKRVLDDGYGVAIQIVRQLENGKRASHMITLWGYRSSEDKPFRGIYVTDSDDDKDIKQAKHAENRLRYHVVAWRRGAWVFSHEGHNWKILAAYALARKPEHHPKEIAQSTPTPSKP